MCLYSLVFLLHLNYLISEFRESGPEIVITFCEIRALYAWVNIRKIYKKGDRRPATGTRLGLEILHMTV